MFFIEFILKEWLFLIQVSRYYKLCCFRNQSFFILTGYLIFASDFNLAPALVVVILPIFLI